MNNEPSTSIVERLRTLKAALPADVTLVAVSKYHSQEDILAAYDCGQRDFGESHEQEIKVKHSMLPADIRWHFIGHLQTNKVKAIVPYIHMIESVDSFRLLAEINRQAEKLSRTINVLLEVKVAAEATKYGFSPDELRALLAQGDWRELHHVRICGLMAMATNTDDAQQIAAEFQQARTFFSELKAEFFSQDESFCVRSWGMSDDYTIAVDNGSNMVRIGTYIFGPRTY